jgi:hypothetical protein
MFCECGCGGETRFSERLQRHEVYLRGHWNRLPHARAAMAARSKGRIKSQETRRRISEANTGRPNPSARGERHALWRGDEVGYSSLHYWVRRHGKKTGICEECGEEKGKTGRGTCTHWANISGEYRRDLSDYKELCRSCHILFDDARRGYHPFQYGLTQADFDAVLAAQEGGCAICRRQPPAGRKRLGVDYDAEQGQIRGLLCPKCTDILSGFRKRREEFVRYLGLA